MPRLPHQWRGCDFCSARIESRIRITDTTGLPSGSDRRMVGLRRPGKPGLDSPYDPTLAYLLSTGPGGSV